MTDSNGIFALHGFTGRGADFAALAADLCPGTGNWQSPDLPGHGPDALTDCSPRATLECIDAVAAQHPQSRTLLGYSMGGRAALLHLLAHPERWDHLILISTNPGISDPTARNMRIKEDAVLADRIETFGVDAFMKHWQEQPLIASQENIQTPWRDAMLTARREHQATGLAASLRQFGQGCFPNLWPELHKVSCPVLLLSGSLDRKYTTIAEQMKAALPFSKHQVLDGAGHMAHLEAPEQATRIILQFLEKQA